MHIIVQHDVIVCTSSERVQESRHLDSMTSTAPSVIIVQHDVIVFTL